MLRKENEMPFSQSASDRPQTERYPLTGPPHPPPFSLFEEAQQAHSNWDAIGPSFDRVDLLSRFEKAAFDGARRKLVLDNGILPWIEGEKNLKEAILLALPCSRTHLLDAYSHLVRFKSAKLLPRGRITIGNELSENELVRSGFAFIRERLRIEYLDARGTTYEYAEVGEDWARYLVSLAHLSDQIENLPKSSLEQGRVLAIQESAFGPILLPPAYWRTFKSKKSDNLPLFFILNKELPAAWPAGNLGPKSLEKRSLEKQAVTWLQGIYDDATSMGKRATKNNVFDQLSVRFPGLSKNGMSRVWQKAEKPQWRSGGSPRKGQKYHFD